LSFGTHSLPAKDLAQIMGRTLLLLPHSDDECNAAALLHHLSSPTLLFLTDSAPQDDYFWRHYGSRDLYELTRREESISAAEQLRAIALFAKDLDMSFSARDQELYKHLPQALAITRTVIQRLRPKTILAPAYEGGHPDHDAASFLAAQLAKEFSLNHWELPYYHRTRSGKFRNQVFLPHSAAGIECRLVLGDAELTRKRALWSGFRSQCLVLTDFSPELESYRRAPQYDYTRPPHSGLLNYEAWGWQATGADLVRSFRSVLDREDTLITALSQEENSLSSEESCGSSLAL
jgi:LmbE family N-acetylglucosaminyl deacetylase